jgi:cytoskeletal protein CcmA (bactofilin family)
MNAKKGGGSLNGFLDRGARLEGTLSFEDVFRIDGFFKGTVTSDSELVVGEGGVVEGDVRVARLAVSGTIKGSIHAKERVELHAGARVFGDIHTVTLVVEEGAVVQGPVESGGPRSEEPVAPQPTAN